MSCRRVWQLYLGMVIVACAGCAGGTPKAAEASVKGTVNLDGKALPEGEVYFVLTGQAPAIFPVKDGAFSGKAYAGKNKVEIRAYQAGPPLSTEVNSIPGRFNDQSEIEAAVTAGGANDFKFDVASR